MDIFLWHFQFNGAVVAALDNNACEDNSAMIIREQETKQKRSLNFSGNKPSTPVLDTVNYPIHMKNLSIQVKLKGINSQINKIYTPICITLYIYIYAYIFIAC